MKLLSAVVLASAAYDLLLGGALLFALGDVQQLLGLGEPLFPINANLNGLFAMAIGVGYLAVLRDPWKHRWYLWIMGPFLKGAGALLLALDFLLRGSPPIFLLFASADAGLAAATVFILLRADPERPAIRDPGERVRGPMSSDRSGSPPGENRR